MEVNITLADNGVRLIGKAAAVVEWTFDERFMTLAKPIDIFPRVDATEG